MWAPDSTHIISLTSSAPIYECLQEHLPNVHMFPACDYRNTAPEELLRAKAISPMGYKSMITGRRRHEELGSPAAVGIWHSVRQIHRQCMSQSWVLILEEDCEIKSMPEFISLISEICNPHKGFSDIDCLVIGCHGEEKHMLSQSVAGLVIYKPVFFWGVQCVLWSQKGMQTLNDLMSGVPLDMQYDHLLYTLGHTSGFDVWCCDGITKQDSRPTTIQTACKHCEPIGQYWPPVAPAAFKRKSKHITVIIVCATAVILIVLWLWMSKRAKRLSYQIM